MGSRSPQLRLHKHDGAIGRLLDFDRLQEQSNRRVIERIKQIGRSAASNEAVERQNALIAANKIDRGQHLYRTDSPLMDRLSNSRLWTAEFNGDAACISASESREWQKLGGRDWAVQQTWRCSLGKAA